MPLQPKPQFEAGYDRPTAITFFLAGLGFGAILALALVPQVLRRPNRAVVSA